MVLYSEVMPYNVVCFKEFVETYNAQMIVVCWGNKKKLTPYIPPEVKGIEYLEESQFSTISLKKLINHFKPLLIYVAGRMEQKYLHAALFARKKNICVVGTSDNQYTNSWKQQLSRLLSHFLWRRYFDAVMIPGLPQYEYMRFLGFKREEILYPQYCADVDLFNSYYRSKTAAGRTNAGRKYILFLGRLIPEKGIDILIDAFVSLKTQSRINLNLLLIGNGCLSDKLPKRADIVHYTFLEQSEIIKLLDDVKMFCLPSRHEPWGVVIHELASAGLPIIATKECGAASAFVRNNYNGQVIAANDAQALSEAILKIDNLSEEECLKYSTRSFELSKQITPSLWAATIKSLI